MKKIFSFILTLLITFLPVFNINNLSFADSEPNLTAEYAVLIDYETGEPYTAHTTNPVPFILVNADPKYTLRENGVLADIVPTLIELMGMEQPKEMTGKSLLIEK